MLARKLIYILKNEGFKSFAFICIRVIFGTSSNKIKRLFLRILLHYKKKSIETSKNFKQGFNLMGQFEYISGIGEVARLFAKKLSKTDVNFVILKNDYWRYIGKKHIKLSNDQTSEFNKKLSILPKFYKNVFFLSNISELKDLSRICKRQYNIAALWWEFETGHAFFSEAFKFLDEVVVFSDFVKDALLKLPNKKCKITKLKFPFAKTWKILESPRSVKEKLNLKNHFTFIFSFDYSSSFERKNPLSILKAFSIAFSNEKVKLIIKSVNSKKFPKEDFFLKEEAKKYGIFDKMLFINDHLSKNEFMTILNSCDCYISLHRGEGLGLGMMEAMSLGKPVIASRYGGNLDFMNDENSLLVDCEMVKTRCSIPIFKDVILWAEPDIKQATSFMKKLYENPDYCLNLGQIAKQSIKNHCSDDNFKKDINLLIRT